MKTYFRKISKSEGYACLRSDVKCLFQDIENLHISFGLTRVFEFDNRCYHRPKINGFVVASATVTRELNSYLQFYVLPVEQYSDEPKIMFREDILPNVKQWFQLQLSKPETAILGVEEIIIEWTGEKHIEHKLKYL